MTGKTLPEFLNFERLFLYLEVMQENLKKYKKNRTVLRGSSTKLINQINDSLKSDEVSFIILEELADQLNIRSTKRNR